MISERVFSWEVYSLYVFSTTFLWELSNRMYGFFFQFPTRFSKNDDPSRGREENEGFIPFHVVIVIMIPFLPVFIEDKSRVRGEG